MKLDSLRRRVAEALRQGMTLSVMKIAFDDLDMPPEPDTSRDDQPWNSKVTYALWRFSIIDDEDFLDIAEKIARKLKSRRLLDEIHDARDAGLPPLDEACRRLISEQYDGLGTIGGRRNLGAFLGEFEMFPSDVRDGFNLFLQNGSESENVFGSYQDGEIDTLTFLDRTGAYAWAKRRFLSMIGASLDRRSRTVHEADVLKKRLAPVLEKSGWTLVNEGDDLKEPVWRIVPLRRGVSGFAKNLIFAADGPKPEFGIYDTINNDIEILSGAENCLFYDRLLPSSGLLWIHLVRWWADLQSIDSREQARIELGKRLRRTLSSDAENNLFMGYFKIFRDKLGDDLPALIPQVYLHHDPKTVKQLNGNKRYPRQRMDFLMLLPNSTRVVIEVDGQHHYADTDRPIPPEHKPDPPKRYPASPKLYAEMVAADRDLRLAGYEVFRFGASELCGDGSEERIRGFFERLLRLHGVL